jgi:hypothetical protein
MAMKLNIFFSAVVLVAVVFPGITQAYSVTNTSATDLGNGYALFTVTYKFGFLNRDLYMPVLANRNTKFTEAGSNVNFSILFDGQTKATATTSTMNNSDMSVNLNYSILPGKAKAMVLSNAAIKDNQYYVPKGTSDTFTLVALVDLRTIATKDDISLQMTSLPFTLVDGKKQTAARVQETELAPFKTSEVTLK